MLGNLARPGDLQAASTTVRQDLDRAGSLGPLLVGASLLRLPQRLTSRSAGQVTQVTADKATEWSSGGGVGRREELVRISHLVSSFAFSQSPPYPIPQTYTEKLAPPTPQNHWSFDP